MFGDSTVTYLIANAASVAAFVVGMLIFRGHRWRGIIFGLFLGFTIGPMIVDAALVESTPAPEAQDRRALSPIKLQ